MKRLDARSAHQSAAADLELIRGSSLAASAMLLPVAVPLGRARLGARLRSAGPHDAVLDQLVRVLLVVGGLASLQPLLDGHLVGLSGSLAGFGGVHLRGARRRQRADRPGKQGVVVLLRGQLGALAVRVPVRRAKLEVRHPSADEGHYYDGRRDAQPAPPSASAGFRRWRGRGGFPWHRWNRSLGGLGWRDRGTHSRPFGAGRLPQDPGGLESATMMWTPVSI